MPQSDVSLTDRHIKRLIYLTGTRATGGYTVVCSAFDGMQDIPVNSTTVGNALVQVLRDVAQSRPDWFPTSKVEAVRPI
jgi:hypothetical protein